MPGMPSAQTLLDQEKRFVFPRLAESDGIRIGRRILELAEARDLPVTVEVRRLGRVVFRAAREGTNAENDMYLAGKARVVERFSHSSFYERQRHAESGGDFTRDTGLPFPEFAPFGGGIPLLVEGEGPVGAVMVSGLAQEDDHALIVEAMDSLLAGAHA
ncbi:heme-degrading domain-containing protein [Poseidonocella sp. HB161398]|uniref:heme-degrading domain-containing protein n=1 Tax=Poseidonocella sp. HB161398 TaxID=2320855 RepID=UPI0011095AF4|nr:heme-binding protein [Poseidonocella sp. HB161398]